MKIIGGHNRGLKLATPKGREVRPILGRVRESLFGILGNQLSEARVADLFAGTGVIGLEALSRGAAGCVFVDRDRACVATINENIRRAQLESRSQVVRADAFRIAEQLAERDPLDLVFVDPPYRMLRGRRNFERVQKLVARLGEEDILAPGGTMVLRHPADVSVPAHLGRLTQIDRRRYGRMKLALLMRQ